MKRISLLLLLVVLACGSVWAQDKIKWNKDGAKMILIPEGSFEMGDHLDNMDNALPVHTVELDAFYMDIHEVTVGQFKQFVEESGYSYNRWDNVGTYYTNGWASNGLCYLE